MSSSQNTKARQAQALLQEAHHQKIEELPQTAITLARLALEISQTKASFKEQFISNMLASMMDDPVGKYFTTCLMDRFFRSKRPMTQWKQFAEMEKQIGLPSFLPSFFKWGLQKLEMISSYWPFFSSKTLEYAVKWQTQEVIASAKPNSLKRHLRKRKKEKIRLNLNHLGEAILGEEEALHRLKVYLKDLQSPDIEYISVKISTLYSQINLLSREKTLEILKERLSKLYKTALENTFIDHEGEKHSKFVNLDMEEFSDLDLTIELFKRTLSEPLFSKVRAGIVLQSYLPDSWPKLLELIEFSQNRVKKGSLPIKIRLVKGANLAMEQWQARLKGWKQAPYPEKKWVDANFKRMLHEAAKACQNKELILGVGSHNLFDICYTMALRCQMNIGSYLELEMLEGMAPQIRKAIHSISGDMLLYCPAATQEEFSSAIAYLVRRLDENTGPENFLRHFFHLAEKPEIFQEQATVFEESFKLIPQLTVETFRKAKALNRNPEPIFLESLTKPFFNEPDTDWSIKQSVDEITHILKNHANQRPNLPCVIAGQKIYANNENKLQTQLFEDPSKRGKINFQVTLANWSLVDLAIKTAQKESENWSRLSAKERAHKIIPVAEFLKSQRGNFIALLVENCAKRVEEADGEISEAIDFIEYYCRQVIELDQLDGLKLKSRGIALITPPWNFPLAIAMGSILGALLTGHPTLFKPAPSAYSLGYKIAELFWQAGLSQDILQIFAIDEASVGLELLKDPRIGIVCLTGSSETAHLFLNIAPSRPLIAETGGKNAMIISSTCDRDLAIKDLVQSAFSYNGQKCSSVSLALIHEELYKDASFWQQLVDATQSLLVGSAYDLENKITPLIGPAEGKLLWALTELEKSQSWVLQPKQDPTNNQLWSPGIVKNIKTGQRRHMEEFFGPVLGIMSYKNLKEAIEIVNQTPYGLTSGIHTLSQEEELLWSQSLQAGNLYINRPTTGALVQRQPFGGMKSSRIGQGRKAGGPQYLLSFYTPDPDSTQGSHQTRYPEKLGKLLSQAPDHLQEELETIFRGYSYWYLELTRKKDSAKIAGQNNFYWMSAQENFLLRWQKDSKFSDEKNFWCALAAASLSQQKLDVSAPYWPSKEAPPSFIHFHEEGNLWQNNWLDKPLQTIRVVGTLSLEELTPLAKRSLTLLLDPVCYHGRYELLHPLREISFCRDYHRYGNLGLEPPQPPVI